MAAQTLRLPYQFHRFPRADMLDGQIGFLRHRNPKIPLHHGNLRFSGGTSYPEMRRRPAGIHAVIPDQGGILFMQADRPLQPRRALQGTAQQLLVQQRDAVIGKPCRSQPAQRLHIRQFPPLHSLRHVGAGIYMNSRLPAFFQHIREGLRIVHRRFRIRHQHHRCKAAPGRSLRARTDVLLISKPGIAKMHVNIYQSGNYVLTF